MRVLGQWWVLKVQALAVFTDDRRETVDKPEVLLRSWHPTSQNLDPQKRGAGRKTPMGSVGPSHSWKEVGRNTEDKAQIVELESRLHFTASSLSALFICVL